MREKHLLEDRIILRGHIKHSDVHKVRKLKRFDDASPDCLKILSEGSIFLNTSLTESFGIAILEAACAGLYVVSTKVGGVPEVLPEDMISFALPEEDGKSLNAEVRFKAVDVLYFIQDVVRAMSEAINIITQGRHDPIRAHERVKNFYDWSSVAERTEKVYVEAMNSEKVDRITRMKRSVYRI